MNVTKLARLTRLAALSLMIALPTASAYAAETYFTDQGHTEVRFGWSHAGVSMQSGEFTKASGKLVLDPDNVEKSTISVTIDAASVSTGFVPLDDHIKSKDFLEVETYPKITFVSTSVKKTGDKTADVTGDLTIHGVTKPVTLKTTLTHRGEHPLGRGHRLLQGQMGGLLGNDRNRSPGVQRRWILNRSDLDHHRDRIEGPRITRARRGGLFADGAMEADAPTRGIGRLLHLNEACRTRCMNTLMLRNTRETYGLVAQVLHWATAGSDPGPASARPLHARAAERLGGGRGLQGLVLFPAQDARRDGVCGCGRPGDLGPRSNRIRSSSMPSGSLKALPRRPSTGCSTAPSFACRSPAGCIIQPASASRRSGGRCPRICRSCRKIRNSRRFFGIAHFTTGILLGLSLVLHIGGALKHAVIDKDATLRRMIPGGAQASQGGTLRSPFQAASGTSGGPILPCSRRRVRWPVRGQPIGRRAGSDPDHFLANCGLGMAGRQGKKPAGHRDRSDGQQGCRRVRRLERRHHFRP